MSLGKVRKSQSFLFSGGLKGNIDLKWVKQLQYLPERHNWMLLA